MKLRFLGTGDAFGSGGRLNTCFLVDEGGAPFLIDCGASAMISVRRFGVDPNLIGAVVLSHLHADHFGGLPSFILDAQLVSRRTEPMIIAGPVGIEKRLADLMESHFPGSSKAERAFPIEIVELIPGAETKIGSSGLNVKAYSVLHPSGNASLALRATCRGRIIAYTGDTEWIDCLFDVGRDADLLIAEAYCYERKVRFHLDYATLREKLPMIGAKRLILTHMSTDMLAQLSSLQGCEAAYDGLDIDIP